MPRIRLEVADILRRACDAYRRDHAGHLGRVERRVMSAVVACRTEALGGHIEACDDCGMARIAYNSCVIVTVRSVRGQPEPRGLRAGSRPASGSLFFHVVFTLPAPITAIAFQNKAIGLRDPV